MDKDKLIEELFDKVDKLTTRLSQLESEVGKLTTENQELKARLNKNSTNSHKPPSSDGYMKRPALPQNKSGKKGGQKGHKGSTLKQIQTPDHLVYCRPGACSCGYIFEQKELTTSEKRQVFDMPIPKLEVTEYQLQKATCPNCGLLNSGNMPKGVNAPVQYGDKSKAFAVLLNVFYKLPYKKTQSLFKDLFGLPINESTIYGAASLCYEKLEPVEDIIKQKLMLSDVVHADETGLRIEGKLQWLHTATSNLYTYLFVHKKRGTEAIQSSKSILNAINGWLVHDCWHSYFYLNNKKHALCGAHILRELQWLIDVKESKWARTFKNFLLQVYKMPYEERVKQKHLLLNRYDQICSIAISLEPEPVKTKGRQKRTTGRNLVERLIREQEAIMAFAFNKEVPFTNNLAERDIRPSKIKQKISNSFRTFRGAEVYARIEGFISTTRKHKLNVFTELTNTINGENFLALPAK